MMSELGLALIRIRNKLRREQQFMRHHKRQEMYTKKRPNFYLEEAETTTLSRSEMIKLLELLLYSKIDIPLLRIIRRNLEHGENNIHLFMSIPGVLDRLVSCLKDSDVEKLLESIGCLTNLCFESHQTTIKVIEKAGPYLITFLHSSNHTLQECCFVCLGNMAADCHICCKYLISQGIVYPTIKSLESSYRNVISFSLYVLKHFTRHHCEENIIELMKHGLLPVLSKILSSKDSDTNILADAYTIFFHVSAHVRISGTELYKESVHHTALNHLGEYCQKQPLNINVIAPIIRCLGNLSSYGDTFSAEILCHACFEISFMIILYSSLPHLKKEAMWLFNNIIASCESGLFEGRISVSSVIDSFLSLIHDNNPTLTEILYTLCLLASKKRELAIKLFHCGLPARLSSLNYHNEEQILLSNNLMSILTEDNI